MSDQMPNDVMPTEADPNNRSGGLQQGWPIYEDVWSRNRSGGRWVESWKGIEQARFALWRKIAQKRAAEGLKPYDLICVSRKNPNVHRFFNIRIRQMQNNDEPLPYPVEAAYSGAEGLLEALLFGDWFVADAETEKKCRAKDEQDTADHIKRVKDNRRNTVLDAFTSVGAK